MIWVLDLYKDAKIAPIITNIAKDYSQIEASVKEFKDAIKGINRYGLSNDMLEEIKDVIIYEVAILIKHALEADKKMNDIIVKLEKIESSTKNI